MTSDIDLILDRINYDPRKNLSGAELDASHLTTLPFPSGYAPRPLKAVQTDENAPLPQADALVVTYTVAEGYALADVLTPGLNTTDWTKYKNGWSELKAQIVGDRAPSLNLGYSAIWAETRIGDMHIIVVKSELHPATDGQNLPMRALWKQMIEQVKPSVVITTGTAGGIGAQTQLGDVIVSGDVVTNCQKSFKNESWAKNVYASSAFSLPSSPEYTKLVAVNASNLGSYLKRPIDTLNGDIESVDFFAFGDETDSYGLAAFDAHARAVEMDDFALGLAIQDIGEDAPHWAAIRNASDPSMPHMATLEEESKAASDIYEKYGYWTSIGSVLACWSILSGV